jgi:hypothetical protein
MRKRVLAALLLSGFWTPNFRRAAIERPFLFEEFWLACIAVVLVKQ